MDTMGAEKEDTMSRFPHAAGIALLCIALAAGAFGGCRVNPSDGVTGVDGLYMTDTFSGKVYRYNPGTHTTSTTSIVTTTQDATGAISFSKGVGYIAVGSGSSTDPGVYCFNPSDTFPQAVRIGGTDRSAQYIAFFSPTKAYVTVADYSGAASEQGVYLFDPANPGAGLSSSPLSGTNAANLYLQQIVVGPDNMIYVANNSALGGTDEVLQIDPSTDTLTGVVLTTSAAGTTALAAGSYGGKDGVFVGNITYADTGSIDFIDTTAIPSPTIVSVLADIDVSRLFYLSTGHLVTTSYTNSYLVSGLASTTPVASELGTDLGGAALAARDGLMYIGWTDYSTSRLYVFDATGAEESFSPVSVMGSGECVAGLAFYED
jgi:hypothetical protein